MRVAIFGSEGFALYPLWYLPIPSVLLKCNLFFKVIDRFALSIENCKKLLHFIATFEILVNTVAIQTEWHLYLLDTIQDFCASRA